MVEAMPELEDPMGVKITMSQRSWKVFCTGITQQMALTNLVAGPRLWFLPIKMEVVKMKVAAVAQATLMHKEAIVMA
jgi:hypothetical protein